MANDRDSHEALNRRSTFLRVVTDSDQTRTSGPEAGTGDRFIKYSTAGAVLCVAAVAAVVSYRHAYALVRAYGEDGWTAWLVPLTVDGLIFASSMVLLHSARRQIAVPGLARWLLGLGIAATLAANAAHGLDHGPIGALVAAWPAVALVGSYELLMLLIRSTRADRVPDSVSDTSPAEDDVPAADSTTEHQSNGLPRGVLDGDPLRIQAANAFGNEIAAGRVPSIRAIRARLRVGQSRAQHVRAHLSALMAEENGGQA